jgi:hypothetical protein
MVINLFIQSQDLMICLGENLSIDIIYIYNIYNLLFTLIQQRQKALDNCLFIIVFYLNNIKIGTGA